MTETRLRSSTLEYQLAKDSLSRCCTRPRLYSVVRSFTTRACFFVFFFQAFICHSFVSLALCILLANLNNNARDLLCAFWAHIQADFTPVQAAAIFWYPHLILIISAFNRSQLLATNSAAEAHSVLAGVGVCFKLDMQRITKAPVKGSWGQTFIINGTSACGAELSQSIQLTWTTLWQGIEEIGEERSRTSAALRWHASYIGMFAHYFCTRLKHRKRMKATNSAPTEMQWPR